MKTIGAVKRRWFTYVREPHLEWTWRLIHRSYAAPGRFYHTIFHVADCLTKLNAIDDMGGIVDRRVAELALIWHDFVYVPGSNENEVLSARMLDAVSSTLKEPRLGQYAHAAILATEHRDGYAGAYGNRTVDAVVDIDLSILGEPRNVYDSYVADVRREYAHVSDDAWRVGRSGFLKGMIARPVIYSLAEMHELLDAKARENMHAELSRM